MEIRKWEDGSHRLQVLADHGCLAGRKQPLGTQQRVRARRAVGFESICSPTKPSPLTLLPTVKRLVEELHGGGGGADPNKTVKKARVPRLVCLEQKALPWDPPASACLGGPATLPFQHHLCATVCTGVFQRVFIQSSGPPFQAQTIIIFIFPLKEIKGGEV